MRNLRRLLLALVVVLGALLGFEDPVSASSEEWVSLPAQADELVEKHCRGEAVSAQILRCIEVRTDPGLEQFRIVAGIIDKPPQAGRTDINYDVQVEEVYLSGHYQNVGGWNPTGATGSYGRPWYDTLINCANGYNQFGATFQWRNLSNGVVTRELFYETWCD